MKKKRYLGILLSFALILTIMPALSLTAYADDVTYYDLWVGGVQVTSENLSGTGWSYTPADSSATPKTPAKLTLNNYSYKGTGKSGSAIYAKEDLKIELSGNNSVTSTSTQSGKGVFLDAFDLTICGTGTLTATAKNGIRAKGVTIDSGTLVASGDFYGIWAQGSKNEGGNITINNGIVQATSSYELGAGIFALNNVTIKDGIVTATSTGSSAAGIRANNNVSIEGGIVSASGKDKAINGTVKNAIAGTGLTYTDNKQVWNPIETSSEGKELVYKEVWFPTYAGLIPASNDTAETLQGKKVKFNGIDWYLIEDNSTTIDAGTVTLLAADTSFGTSYFQKESSVAPQNDYSASTVKGYLDKVVAGTAGEGKPNFKDVADAIITNTDAGGKLYLLSTSEAEKLSNDVRKMNSDTSALRLWWLRTPGSLGNIYAALVHGNDGHVDKSGVEVINDYGVRPALQLDMSKVTFDSESNTFSVITPYPLWVGGTQVTSTNKDNVLDDGGKVKYNPVTKTLTLNKPEIKNIYSQSGSLNACIYTESDKLVINGSANLTNPDTTNNSVGIYASGCDVELNGDFSIKGGYYGIRAKNITISGGNVNATGEAAGAFGTNIIINGGTLTSAAEHRGLTAYNNITISDGLSIVRPTYGKVVGNDYGKWIVDAQGNEANVVVISSEQDLWLVTFVDGQGNVLKAEAVKNGQSATAPAAPTRAGYTFDGWDKYFSSIIEDLTVTATWKENITPGGGGTVDTVQQVVDMIKALPNPQDVTINDEAKIKEAREAFDKLTEEQKKDPKLTQALKDKLMDCEDQLAKAKKSAENQKAASKVSDMIKALPDDPAKATSDQVSSAVEAFNSLTPDQKALITDGEVAKLQNALNYPAKMLKAKMKSVKALKGRKAVAKWGKKSGANGYQLYYKAKGVKAKKVNINSAKTLKKTVKKLKAGKTYSFKVRTFTKVQNLSDPDNPKKVYGKWSNVKKAKAKK